MYIPTYLLTHAPTYLPMQLRESMYVKLQGRSQIDIKVLHWHSEEE